MSDDNFLSFAEQVGKDIGGILKGLRPSTERTLDADEDLNTLLDRGLYNATYNIVDWEAQNYPGNMKGYVVVETMETVNYITQYFYSRSNINEPYTAYRFMVTAGWSPWIVIHPTPDPYRLDTSVGTRVFVGGTMVHGDTGWRSLTADVINGWTSNGVHIRRVGSFVQFRAYQLDGSAATSSTFLEFPLGFGNRGTGWYLPLTQGDTLLVTGARNAYLSSGKVYFKGGYHMSSSVIVSDDWPSSLPGTPA